jgi:probable rRNA maturation factor
MINVDKKENLVTTVKFEVIKKTALKVLEHFQKKDEFDLTVFLTDNEQIKGLNLTWMGQDGPTDVLSFPSDELEIDTGHPYLGDIIISVEKALEQADIGGHKLEEECQLLVVHGVLHLLGLDHANEEEKREMWDHQQQILEKLGLGSMRITE